MRAVALLTGLAALAAALLAGAGSAGAQNGFVQFRSPSGNINCLLGTGGGQPDFAQCFVRSASWAHRPRRPASCHFDWFPTQVNLNGRRPSVGQCRSDVGPECVKGTRCPVLPYGHSVKRGGTRCWSVTTGVTCRRIDGRRPGFSVARQGYVLYR